MCTNYKGLLTMWHNLTIANEGNENHVTLIDCAVELLFLAPMDKIGQFYEFRNYSPVFFIISV